VDIAITSITSMFLPITWEMMFNLHLAVPLPLSSVLDPMDIVKVLQPLDMKHRTNTKLSLLDLQLDNLVSVHLNTLEVLKDITSLLVAMTHPLHLAISPFP